MSQCGISSQVNSHLSRESDLESQQEWKDQWVEEKVNEAMESLKENGDVSFGDYTPSMFGSSPREIFFKAMDFLESERAADIMNDSVFHSMNCNDVELSDKMDLLSEELRKGLTEYVEAKAGDAYEEMLKDSEENRLGV